MYLATGLLGPNRGSTVDGFAADLQALLPPDYSRFLREYGTGTYAGEVYIGYPDQAAIPTTFGEYLDLWNFSAAYNEADLLHSTQLAQTANGDILCVAPARPAQVFILPRHSEQVSAYASFFDAVNALIPSVEVYFDPDFEAVQEQISLVKNGQLVAIEPLHQAFLEQFRADFVANAATQPKYFFQALGGWVSFDLVYRNTITVKYQQSFAAQAQPLLRLLHQHTG